MKPEHGDTVLERVRSPWYTLAVVLLLATFFLQSVLAMRRMSVSSDETYHLPAGFTYLKTGDFRLNREHPPLIKELAALPLLFLRPELNLNDPAWLSSPPRQVPFGVRFLHTNDADRLLFWGRLPVVLLSVLLGIYVFRWAEALFGAAAGLSALFLFTFSPNLLAHSHLVTMDAGLSCFTLITLYYLWRWVRNGGKRSLILATLALGAALGTKFSAAFLLAIAPLLLGLAALWPPSASSGAMAAGSQGRRVRAAAWAMGLSLPAAAGLVWALYFFPSDPLFYLRGLQEVNANHDPDYYYYLWGTFAQGGWWYYPLAAFLIKTPLPTLILLILSLLLMRRFPAPDRLDELFLVLPTVSFVALTCAFADNIGVRYLLPIYPLIFVFVSRLARAVTRHRRGTVALAGLLAFAYAADTLRLHPDHLAYFNSLVGGPKNGHMYLDDSNIDWGQDLKRLRDYLEEHKIDRVRLLYRWNADPDYYGIRWRPIGARNWRERPAPGYYAISTQWLIRGRLTHQQLGHHTDWLERYEPIDRVGYSFYIFRFE